MQLIKSKLGLSEDVEKMETEVESPLELLNEVKKLYRSLKIDFEEEETLVRKTLWLKEVSLLMDREGTFTVDTDDFKALD